MTPVIQGEQLLTSAIDNEYASIAFLLMLAFTATVLVLSFWLSLRQQQQQQSNNHDLFSKFVQQQRKHLSDLRGPLSSFWDEWAPPPLRTGDSANNNKQDPYADLLFATEEIRVGCSATMHVTHFCFLLHGHRGTSRDLGYVQAAMRRTASTTTNNVGQRLVLHSVSCNEKKTDDGVEAGGERVVEEMISVIRERMQHCKQDRNANGYMEVTISMLGNSLGGLYARYALSVLRRKCEATCKQPSSSQTLYLDGKYAVHWNVFCTTATPHLGVASHTFLPLPRRAEVGVAHAMGQSGKDLFRLNALLRHMATQPRFLEPLAAFRKRTAYANAFSTDFPVPACTAAFLHSNNTYPHYFVETRETRLSPSSDEEDELSSSQNDETDTPSPNQEQSKPNCSLVIATLHTPARQDSRLAERCCAAFDTMSPEQQPAEQPPPHGDTGASNEAANPDAELAYMSATLDSLGWKKVFVDMRKEVPRIVVPKSILRHRPLGSSSENSCSSDNDTASTGSEQSSSNQGLLDTLPIHVLKAERQVVTSRDLVAAVTETGEMGVYWPLGHNMMVAFSRSRWSTYMNRAGRPVVDALAREIVHDILSWDASSDDAQLTD